VNEKKLKRKDNYRNKNNLKKSRFRLLKQRQLKNQAQRLYVSLLLKRIDRVLNKSKEIAIKKNKLSIIQVKRAKKTKNWKNNINLREIRIL
jgi:hypothetical protein